ncbi:MAG: double-strand break repair helicase AddA, partial [Rhodobacterales bacterium]
GNGGNGPFWTIQNKVNVSGNAITPECAALIAKGKGRAPKILSPSDLGGAKALPGEPLYPEDEAKARGNALHLLLERLPLADPSAWDTLTTALIPDSPLAAALLVEARAVLDALPDHFTAETLAEVAVTGLWNGQQMLGSIDRLLVRPDRVLVIDYKSNSVIPRTPAEVPEGILRQMGAYAHLLGQIYPDRRVEVAILWTRGPLLMPLDPDIVRLALSRATIP